jgi:hypothetical protein
LRLQRIHRGAKEQENRAEKDGGAHDPKP